MRLRTVMSRRIAWCAGRPSKVDGRMPCSSTSNASGRRPNTHPSNTARATDRLVTRSRTMSLTCLREPGAKKEAMGTPTNGSWWTNIATQAGFGRNATFPFNGGHGHRLLRAPVEQASDSGFFLFGQVVVVAQAQRPAPDVRPNPERGRPQRPGSKQDPESLAAPRGDHLPVRPPRPRRPSRFPGSAALPAMTLRWPFPSEDPPLPGGDARAAAAKVDRSEAGTR